MRCKEAKGLKILKRCRQSGAAMVEFAFVFPLLLFLTYGLVVYSYVFVLQESITFVAQQAAASAVSVAPGSTSTNASITTLAQKTVTEYLNWLSADQISRLTTTVNFCPASAGVTCPTDGNNAVVVTVNFNMNAPSPLFPTLDFGSGAFPPMPANLVSTATVRL